MPRWTTRETVASRSEDIPTAEASFNGRPSEERTLAPVTLATLAMNARALRAPFAERPKAEDAPRAAATTAGWIRGTRGDSSTTADDVTLVQEDGATATKVTGARTGVRQ